MAMFSKSTLNRSSLKRLPSSSMTEEAGWTSADLSVQARKHAQHRQLASVVFLSSTLTYSDNKSAKFSSLFQRLSYKNFKV